MALTGKKLMFAEAILSGKSKKDAAILAGYSAATASAAGSRLAKDKAVLAHLQVQLDARKDSQSDAPAPVPDLYDLSPDTPIVWTDPRQFLLVVMNHKLTDMKHRVNAAKTLMPYEHGRKDDLGKKEERELFAKVAEQGSGWDGLLQ